jgi:hypothetical protein
MKDIGAGQLSGSTQKGPRMGKIVFLPVRLLSGLFAGVLSKKLVSAIWGTLDDEHPPQPAERQADVRRLALALFIQGAVFSLVRGLVDHSAREGFRRLTGTWPGEQGPAADEGAQAADEDER